MCDFVYVATWFHVEDCTTHLGEGFSCWLWRSQQAIGKAHMAWSRDQPLANRQKETKILSTEICKELTSSKKHAGLGADSSPFKAEMSPPLWPTLQLQVWEALRSRTCLPLTYGPLTHGNHDMIKMCYFKPLCFRWYCYIATENECCWYRGKVIYRSQNEESVKTRSKQKLRVENWNPRAEDRHQLAERKEKCVRNRVPLVVEALSQQPKTSSEAPPNFSHVVQCGNH